ncbi:MAG TPA: chorismate mutase [Patescibacteria group bacterium]|nr:chorismate mutase [Patescibacteria group bacterium]
MMKKSNPDFIKKALAPYRKEIDRIDDALLKLLGERFDIVRKVAKVKIKHDIPAFLGDRVTQVRERAATNGQKYGIDPEFMRTLYTLIIYQSCATEDMLKGEAAARPAKKAKKK